MTKNELITKLRRELSLRNYADSSIKTYCGCLSVFLSQYTKYNGYKDIEDIKDFLLTITNVNYHKQFVATIFHFFRYVVGKPIGAFEMPYPRKTHYLPQIFSVQEVYRLINSIENIKHKAIIQIMYSCALRIGEVIKIKITHVDGDRKLLCVKGAKGFKDRFVPIPDATLQLLRTYFSSYKPKEFLFNGQFSLEYSVRSIQQIFYRACRKAKINKDITPHCLRHSRLTHLKEAGMDIYELKDVAGHNQIKTTEIYLHLAKETLSNRIAQADLILSQIVNPSKMITA